MNVSIDVDARELHRALRVAPLRVLAGLNQWVSTTTFRAERQAKQEASDSVDTGQTQSSIHSSIGNLKGTVRPTAKHAIFAHEGRKPGRMPPWREGTSLSSWARRHGLNAFLVARSIAQKGTKGDPFMKDAYTVIKPSAERNASKMLDDIVRSI